jgi:hypothetical protein
MPLVKDWKSKVFWMSFWLGGLFVLNLQVVIGKEMQPLHWVAYYFEPFLMIYLADLGLEVWLKMRDVEFSAFAKQKVFSITAILIFVVGVGLTVFRLNLAAVVQTEYTRKDNEFEQLITTLKQQDPDLIILTSDRYLNRLLPGYVTQRFVVPTWNDPMTNKQLALLENASANLLGWPSWSEMAKDLYHEDVKPFEIPERERLSLDTEKMLLIINRHNPGRIRLESSNIIMTNEDFEVGFLTDKNKTDVK